MTSTGTGLAALTALDHGAYRDAILRFESQHPSRDTVETIWRAEVALYLHRLDDARDELDRLAGALDRDLTNRVQTIRAEIAFWDNALDEARDLVAPVIRSTGEIGDLQGLLRATLLRARVELRRGRSAEALDLMKEPRRLATVLGNDFYVGIIAHCRAFAYYYLGEFRQAGHAFAEALHLLKQSEGVRWELSCRTLYAAYLAEIGRADDALAECDDCERVALELGLVNDALFARTNAAGTLYMLGRFEEVVERLKGLLPWERATQHIFAETSGLILLSMALGELERFDEAERAASEAIQVSRLTKNDLAALDAEILVHWAAGRAGKPQAIEASRRLIDVADRSGTAVQRCEARLYLADVLRTSKPDLAVALCRETRGMAIVEENVHVRKLLDRIERSLSQGPIRFGLNGELVIDPNAGWPDYDQAIETVKRFLVLEAVRRSDGNRSEAARKLSLTRSRLHDLWRQVHGDPPRPVRGDAGETVRPGADASVPVDVERVEHQTSLV